MSRGSQLVDKLEHKALVTRRNNRKEHAGKPGFRFCDLKLRSQAKEELANVQELALVIVEVYFVDPKVYTHLRNLEYRHAGIAVPDLLRL